MVASRVPFANGTRPIALVWRTAWLVNFEDADSLISKLWSDATGQLRPWPTRGSRRKSTVIMTLPVLSPLPCPLLSDPNFPRLRNRLLIPNECDERLSGDSVDRGWTLKPPGGHPYCCDGSGLLVGSLAVTLHESTTIASNWPSTSLSYELKLGPV